MKELARLVDSAESPGTRAILRSALADAPPDGSLPRVAAALGLAVGAVAVAAPVAASVSSTAVAGAVGVAGKVPLGAGASFAVLSKWLMAGVVGGVLVSGTAAVVEHVRAPGSTASPPVTMGEAPVIRSERAMAPSLNLNPMPETPDPPVPATTEAAPSAPNAAPAPSSSGSLGAEAARIDAARRALASGELEQALRHLDEYQRQRTLGVLDREALLLRIQVLVRRGDAQRAVILAQSYLASHPNDAHAARLRALIDDDGKHWPGIEGIER